MPTHANRKTTTVRLVEPVRLFDNEPVIEEITLMEPTARDLFRIGDPVLYYDDNKGGGTVTEILPAIEQYLDCCITHPQGSTLLNLLNMRDGRALKGALLDFFRVAPKAPPE